MSGLDLSRLSVDDAIAAIRSFPGRYRQASHPGGDDDPAELAERIGPDGVSALDLTIDTLGTWIVLERALTQILTSDEAVLHPGVSDPAQRTWNAPANLDLEGALDMLGDEAHDLAERAERAATVDWSRSAPIAGGGTLGAVDALREAVRVGSTNLRAVERTITAVRSEER